MSRVVPTKTPQTKSRENLVAEIEVLKSRDGETFFADGQEYKWQDGATAISDLPNLVPAKAVSHSEQFGISGLTNTGDDTFTGDYSTEIQAAHDYMASIGGGKILFPQGVFPISSTVYLGEGRGVTLEGLGRGSIGGSKTEHLQSGVTRFHWNGATDGTMFELTSDRNNTGNNPRYSGGGIVDCMIDGNETAGYGLRVWSHAQHYLRPMVSYCTKVHFTAGVLSNGVKTNNTANVQRFRWNLHLYDGHSSNEADALFWVDGTSTVPGNVSLGHIEDLHIRPEASAVAAHFGSSDTLTIDMLHAATRATATGDGGKVFLHAANTLPVAIGTASDRHCRSLTFNFVQAKQGFVAKADTVGSYHSENNVINMFSTENGGDATPTIETNAELYYVTDNGVANLKSVRGEAIVGTVSQVSGVPTGAIFEEGSDSNGSYIKFADGTMICHHVFDLVYDAAANLEATWTFPETFVGVPNVSGMLNSSNLNSNATPGNQEVLEPRYNTLGTSSTRVTLYRISGMTNFLSGDTAEVSVTAFGRWYN